MAAFHDFTRASTLIVSSGAGNSSVLSNGSWPLTQSGRHRSRGCGCGTSIPERWGRDCGIDLVFKHKNGETWAVQAKCYSPEHEITKADIEKFPGESNRKWIDHQLLIATTDRIGVNAKQVYEAFREKSDVRYRLGSISKMRQSITLIASTNWGCVTAKRRPSRVLTNSRRSRRFVRASS